MDFLQEILQEISKIYSSVLSNYESFTRIQVFRCVLLLRTLRKYL